MRLSAAKCTVRWLCHAVLLCGIASPISAIAQNDPQDLSVVPLPEGVSELPEPEATPLTISSANAPDFRAILPSELSPLFRSGSLIISANRALKYVWRLDDAWEGLARESAVTNDRLLEQGGLSPQVKLQATFPFGSAFDLVPRENDADTGAKILWNAQAALWGQRSIEAPFALYWYKENRIQRLVRGVLLRAYPQLLGNTSLSSNRQLFREKLVLRSPDALSGMTVITFRFLGAIEDVLWMYSPAIQKARQLTGSNRSDALFRTALSLDDFFVWSGKPELVEAKLDGTRVILGAFAGNELAPLTAGESGCFSTGETTDGVTSSTRFSNLATVFLNTSSFAPRRTWRLELTGRDPYSLYGRQVLYIDHESMLPLYKFVYDRSGHLWKSIIGVYGLAATHDRSARRTFPAMMYVHDHRDDTTQILHFPRITTCATETEMLKAAQFDPHRLWPKAGAKPSEPSTASPPPSAPTVAAPEPTSDVDD